MIEEEMGASINKAEEKERAWVESENARVQKEVDMLFLLNC